MRKKNFIFQYPFLTLFCLSFICVKNLFSNTFGAYGVGRYTGQSGAGAAQAYDQNAIFMNPAGMAYPQDVDFFQKEYNYFERDDKKKAEDVQSPEPNSALGIDEKITLQKVENRGRFISSITKQKCKIKNLVRKSFPCISWG